MTGPELRRSGARRDGLLLGLLVLLLALPLAVALAALREPRWYPSADIAQTELRVRDVGSAHPPLTGLGGRIGTFGPDQGSHPGPLSFWSLSVPYRLVGASSWALQVATASLHLVAMGAALWLARRRGGTPLLLGVGAVLLALVTAYGGYALTLPWNPYLPMLWWVVFTLGVWSVLRRDLAALPVTVFAASFCLQTHISYVGLVGAVSAIGAAGVVAALHGSWRDPRRRRRDLTWVALGVLLLALVWLPPLAEQLTGSQGHNLTTIVQHFGEPPEEPIGMGDGVDLLLANLDPSRLLTEPVVDDVFFLGGSPRPGTLLLVAWALAVAVAWRLRERALLQLHGVLAVALVAASVSVSRIFGPPWPYLALWTWGISGLLLLAVAWSAVVLLQRVAPAVLRVSSRIGVVGAAVVLLGLTGRAAVDAADTEDFRPELSAAGAALVPDTVDALADGAAPGGGRDGRYLVTWEDPPFGGARGYLLLNELDRAGFEVGASPFHRAAVTRHRVLEPAQATARVHLAVGADLARWRADPGFREVATYEPSGDELDEIEELLHSVGAALGALGREDLVAHLREDPQRLDGAAGLPFGVGLDVARLIELRSPAAVFVGPPRLEPG